MRRKAMTIIELLVVIVIIVLLAAALLPALSKARQIAKKSLAREDIHQLEIALQSYGDYYGTYPLDEGATDCGDLIRALEENVEDGPYSSWASEAKDGNGNLLDPWGNSYRYRTTNVEGTGMGFNIWSEGPDKVSDNDDDITNW